MAAKAPSSLSLNMSGGRTESMALLSPEILTQGGGVSYLVPTLCNTFSTTQDLFLQPMSALVEAVGRIHIATEDVSLAIGQFGGGC